MAAIEEIRTDFADMEEAELVRHARAGARGAFGAIMRRGQFVPHRPRPAAR